MKLKEIRLLDIIVKQDGNVIYEGKAEELPEELKNKEYKDINFEGIKVVAEI